MAAYGGHAAVEGIQIFVTLQRGAEYPLTTTDVRVNYEQTIGDIKQAVAKKLGVPVEKQQYFWHKRELTAADEGKSLLELNMHTGFQLKGYDLTVEPQYWPPVKQTPEGLVLDC